MATLLGRLLSLPKKHMTFAAMDTSADANEIEGLWRCHTLF